MAATILKAPPTPSTPLLGREQSLDAAVHRVREGARLLTVTGYGGTGKTRFSIELFRRLAPEYPGGAAFVSLASVTAASAVLPAIGSALEIPEAHGRSALDALSTVIGQRRMLMVLDNLEQVIDVAEEIAALVERCPALQVIATSRAPLKIGAETEFVLPPLELPAQGMTSLDALRNCPSVALFLQRSLKVKQDFALTETNAAVVAAICRRLDGLPLALELAAARVRVLEPAALLQRLDHALDLLTSGDRDLPLRQRTLRATISWSYSLLDAAEQQLLRRLSCFHEGWTFEAMEQVCYGDERTPPRAGRPQFAGREGPGEGGGLGRTLCAARDDPRIFVRTAPRRRRGGRHPACACGLLPAVCGRSRCRDPQHRAARGFAARPQREREHASRHPVAH